MGALSALRASIALVRRSLWLLLMFALAVRFPLAILHGAMTKALRVWLVVLVPQPWNHILGLADRMRKEQREYEHGGGSVLLFKLRLPR